jgi:LAS superfamily LD-carboxypeptidase LdcB
MTKHGSISPARVLLLLGLLLVALVPTASAAKPPDDKRSNEEKRAEVRAKRGEVKIEVDVLQARNSELTTALATLTRNVAEQQGQLEEAQRVAAEAENDLVEAEAAVVAAQSRIDELDQASRRFLVDAYMSPPSDSAFDALDARTIADATIKHALLDLYADSEADVLDQLTAAHEDVEVERANKAEVAAEAERTRVAAADAVARVQAAQAQQQAFADEAEAALERKLAESAQLAEMDQQLSRKIAEEQAALARRLAEQAAARGGGAASRPTGPGTITAVPGGLASVSCPGGTSITIASGVAGELRQLLDAAASDGVVLCGWGYRDPQQQINLRRAHCGGSDFAIWHMSAGACSPPTARPGFSMHEVGQAIDFYCDGGSSIGSRQSRCYKWLSQHARDYGLYNLPSEPWHWSTNGH